MLNHNRNQQAHKKYFEDYSYEVQNNQIKMLASIEKKYGADFFTKITDKIFTTDLNKLPKKLIKQLKEISEMDLKNIELRIPYKEEINLKSKNSKIVNSLKKEDFQETNPNIKTVNKLLDITGKFFLAYSTDMNGFVISLIQDFEQEITETEQQYNIYETTVEEYKKYVEFWIKQISKEMSENNTSKFKYSNNHKNKIRHVAYYLNILQELENRKTNKDFEEYFKELIIKYTKPIISAKLMCEVKEKQQIEKNKQQEIQKEEAIKNEKSLVSLEVKKKVEKREDKVWKFISSYNQKLEELSTGTVCKDFFSEEDWKEIEAMSKEIEKAKKDPKNEDNFVEIFNSEKEVD